MPTDASQRREFLKSSAMAIAAAVATLVRELPHEEKVEMLAAHPAIGQRTGLSARSR